MILHSRLRTLSCAFAVFALAACGGHTQEKLTELPPPAPAQPQPLPPVQPETLSAFTLWVEDFKQEALSKGVSQEVLDNAFAHVKEPSPKVLELDHTQPEQTKSFDEYVSGFLKPARIDAAHAQWQSHAELLDKVHKAYDVPIPILLALWQVESRFGAHQGSYSIVQALTTLAYDGRRSQFFRKQLLDAMTILQQEHMDAANLTGSWAGAMGQVQFMPSSYLSFAVDFDGDGRKNIWTSDADAAASMANYLHTKGWDPHKGWGMRVRLPEGGVSAICEDSKAYQPIKAWQKLGLRAYNGAKLPKRLADTRLVMPDNKPENAYLVTSNYDVIMDWNHSTYFATAIGLLADADAASR